MARSNRPGRPSALSCTAATGLHPADDRPGTRLPRRFGAPPRPRSVRPAVGGGDVFALTAEHQLLKVCARRRQRAMACRHRRTGRHVWRHPGADQWLSARSASTTSSRSIESQADGEWRFAPARRLRSRAVPRRRASRRPVRGLRVRPACTRIDTQGWPDAVDCHHRPPGGEHRLLAPRRPTDWSSQASPVMPHPSSGGLVALSLADGRERWRFDFPRRAVSTHVAGGPVVAGDVVVAASGDGQLWAVNLQQWISSGGPPRLLKGALDGIVPASEQDYRALAVAGATIVAGSTTGYVAGLRLRRPRGLAVSPAGASGPPRFQWLPEPGRRLRSVCVRLRGGSRRRHRPTSLAHQRLATGVHLAAGRHRRPRDRQLPTGSCGLYGPTRRANNEQRSGRVAVHLPARRVQQPDVARPPSPRPVPRARPRGGKARLTRAGTTATVTMTVEDQGSPTATVLLSGIVRGRLPHGDVFRLHRRRHRPGPLEQRARPLHRAGMPGAADDGERHHRADAHGDRRPHDRRGLLHRM